MRPEQDAYGAILHAIHTGDDPKAGEIIERDDGYIEHTGPATTYFKEYENWSQQTQDAIEHTYGTVLDIGCGAGRHALYVQNQQNLPIRAIDVSPKAIQVTKDRSVQNTTIAGLTDIHELPEAPYDTIIMLGNNLGLLGTNPIQNLNNLAEHTTENATLIGQTRAATQTQNPAHLQYHEYNKQRGRRPGCLRMRIRYKHYKTPYFDYLYIDQPKLKELLQHTPWTLQQIYTKDNTPMYTIILTKQ